MDLATDFVVRSREQIVTFTLRNYARWHRRPTMQDGGVEDRLSPCWMVPLR